MQLIAFLSDHKLACLVSSHEDDVLFDCAYMHWITDQSPATMIDLMMKEDC